MFNLSWPTSKMYYTTLYSMRSSQHTLPLLSHPLQLLSYICHTSENLKIHFVVFALNNYLLRRLKRCEDRCPFLLLSIPLCGSWFPLVPFSFCLKHCEHSLRCRSPGASVCLTKLPCTIVGRACAEFGIAGRGPSSTTLRLCALPSSLAAPAAGLLPSQCASPPDQSPLAALECLLTTDLQPLGHDALGVLCPLGFVGYGLPQIWIFSAIISATFFVSPATQDSKNIFDIVPQVAGGFHFLFSFQPFPDCVCEAECMGTVTVGGASAVARPPWGVALTLRECSGAAPHASPRRLAFQPLPHLHPAVPVTERVCRHRLMSQICHP